VEIGHLLGVSAMRESSGAKLGASMLAVLTVGLTACSSGADDRTSASGAKTSASDATSSSTPATTTGLERFLLVRGEEPGYQPSGSVTTISDVTEYAAGDELTQTDVPRLREEGFDRLLYRPLEGTDRVGITSLVLFSSAAGAQRDSATDRRNLVRNFRGWTVKRFDVPGVSSAFGWTATRPGNRVGNVRWVEGRCVITIGNAMHNARASSFVGPLAAGAQAMHRRIAGQCP
jgi:hypothetical protein